MKVQAAPVEAFQWLGDRLALLAWANEAWRQRVIEVTGSPALGEPSHPFKFTDGELSITRKGLHRHTWDQAITKSSWIVYVPHIISGTLGTFFDYTPDSFNAFYGHVDSALAAMQLDRDKYAKAHSDLAARWFAIRHRLMRLLSGSISGSNISAQLEIIIDDMRATTT